MYKSLCVLVRSNIEKATILQKIKWPFLLKVLYKQLYIWHASCLLHLFCFKLQTYFLLQPDLSCVIELLPKNMLRKTPKQNECKNSINIVKIISINVN